MVLDLATKSQATQSNSLWSYRRESLLVSIVNWIPQAPGIILRNWVYRSFFAKLGSSVKIQPGVELVQPNHIEIGDRVTIKRRAYLSSAGTNKTQHENSSICLEEGVNLGFDVQLNTYGCESRIHLRKQVILDRGVDIRSLDHGPVSYTHLTLPTTPYV